jgi:hypothetical protein
MAASLAGLSRRQHAAEEAWARESTPVSSSGLVGALAHHGGGTHARNAVKRGGMQQNRTSACFGVNESPKLNSGARRAGGASNEPGFGA